MSDDAITAALQTRRLPHSRGKSGHKSKGKGGGSAAKPFNPLSTLGRYAVHIGPGSIKSLQRRSVSPDSSTGIKYIEIHELVHDETGLLGSFDLGQLNGVFVLAGSRAGLQSIVDELEVEAEHDERDAEDHSFDDDGKLDGSTLSRSASESGDSEVDSTSEHEPVSALEAEDERINRRMRAFEKNSFRNPKFWMRWQGCVMSDKVSDDAVPHTEPSGIREWRDKHDERRSRLDATALTKPTNASDIHTTTTDPINTEPADSEDPEKLVQSDLGYLVFSNNECDRFEGTMNCVELGWRNIKIRGRKVHSRARPCPIAWK